jgi:hypothetical protein
MKRKHPAHSRGLTIIEAVITGAILSFLALGVVRLIDKPAKVSARILQDQRGRTFDKVVDSIIKDLQEASYQTVASNLTADPSTGIAPFAQYHYDGANRKISWISFEYNSDRKELWRVQDDTLDHSSANPRRALLMDHVTPAFSIDPSPNSNIVIVNLTYNSGGQVLPGQSGDQVVHERVAVRQ